MSFWKTAFDVVDAVSRAADGYERGRQLGNLLLADEGTTGRLHEGESQLLPVMLPIYSGYVFRLTQPLFTDFDLAVFDQEGHPVASDTSDNAISSVAIRGSGLVFIAVHAHRGFGEFSLSLTRVRE